MYTAPLTWANNWNGVNHPATAPDEEPTPAEGEVGLVPAPLEIFNSPSAELQPIGGWETAR